jgi:alcohol dehydrogenase class IV
LCLGPVNTAAVHALAYPLGGEFHIAHGLANALLLTHVMRFNAQAAPDRYAEISRNLEVPPGKSNLETALRGIDCLEELCRACGIPRHLQDFGIPASAIPCLAKGALQVQRLLKNNPREITQADAEMIYRQAF